MPFWSSMALLFCASVAFLYSLSPAAAVAVSKRLPPPWGDSLFGEWEAEGSAYRHSGLHDIRHVGWSWNAIQTNTPFCSTLYNTDANDSSTYEISTCTYPTEPCAKMGGTMLDSICMADPGKPFTVVGPDCWNTNCSSIIDAEVADRMQTCTGALDGAIVHPTLLESTTGQKVLPMWCLVPGRHTVLGPACYGDTCFTDELQTVCTGLGGTVYADLYCVMDQKYTVVGPVCKPNATTAAASATLDGCFPQETIDTCTALGGTTVGDVFCILNGQFSALGPFCYGGDDGILGTNQTECFADRGHEICTTLGGTSFGEGLFCVLKGQDYHVMGDYWGGGCIGLGDRACKEDFGGMDLGTCGCVFKGDYTVGAPLRWGSASIVPEWDQRTTLPYEGNGFILNGTYTLYGPTCYGGSCSIATEGCKKAGGISVGGIFCAISGKDKSILSFAVDGGLPGGIILVLAVLSGIVFLESIAILSWWWNMKRAAKGEIAGENAVERPDKLSGSSPLERPLEE